MSQAKKLVLRIQSSSGRFVVDGLTQDSTLWNLQKILEDKTTIHPDYQKILYGYPPKELADYNPLLTLESLNIKSGDTLTLEELKSKRERTVGVKDVATTTITSQPVYTALPNTAPHSVTDNSSDLSKANFSSTSRSYERSLNYSGDGINSTEAIGTQQSGGGLNRGLDHTGRMAPEADRPHKKLGKLTRKVVPADNSCLFKTISILLCNNADTSTELRELAACIIMSNPDKFSSILLGKTNTDYTQWLLKSESWGGGIELTVFSEYYKVELDVVDIQTQRVDRFGESSAFERRALLLYDGIHYDPLVIMDKEGNILETTFPVSNDTVICEALDIASEAHKARQFTDVAKFSLRCLVCGTALTGHTDAQSHAQKTGHINFGEV